MATSGEMIRIVADALILPTATVTSFHEMLRKERLVTIGGRGRSASQMTAEDVAKLLITVMGSDKLDEAAAKCRLLTATVGLAGTTEKGREVPVKRPLSLLQAVVNLLTQVKPRSEPLPGGCAHLPIVGDVSVAFVFLEVWGSTLEGRIAGERGSLDFYCVDERHPDAHPDDWSSLPIEERLLAKAEQGGLITKRSIDRVALIRASWALP